VRAENHALANGSLIGGQAGNATAGAWGGGLVAAVDGTRFVVPIRSNDARANPKYFNRKKGATLLNMINDQAMGVAAKVVSGTPRDSLHAVDLMYRRDGGRRPEVFISDTGSYVVTWTPRAPLLHAGGLRCRPLGRWRRWSCGSVSAVVRTAHTASNCSTRTASRSRWWRDSCGSLRPETARRNTLVSYAYDLRHLWRFFARRGLTWQEFAPRDAIPLLEYLRSVPSSRPRQRMTLAVVTTDAGTPATKLAATTVNRILAAVSSFYEYLILAGCLDTANPIEKRPDPALARVSDRHLPFMGRASRQRPVRRAVRVKTVQRVPRPLDDDQVTKLLGVLRCQRDRAIVLLMLQGGLRPGEVLGLRLEDVAYGRRRVVVRHRDDHPKGARSKSRYERVVDLHEPEALATLSTYVMSERPPMPTAR
jgi:integrase